MILYLAYLTAPRTDPQQVTLSTRSTQTECPVHCFLSVVEAHYDLRGAV
jgi:hypothetical protein